MKKTKNHKLLIKLVHERIKTREKLRDLTDKIEPLIIKVAEEMHDNQQIETTTTKENG